MAEAVERLSGNLGHRLKVLTVHDPEHRLMMYHPHAKEGTPFLDVVQAADLHLGSLEICLLSSSSNIQKYIEATMM